GRRLTSVLEKECRSLFIHMGNCVVVESTSIISILDVQLEKTSSKLQRMIKEFEEKDQPHGDKPTANSVVITDNALYYSPLSTLTLKKTKELYQNTIDTNYEMQVNE